MRKSIQSRMDLVELSNRDLTKDALVHLAKSLSFSINQMAQLLSVTERTIQRYTSENRAHATVEYLVHVPLSIVPTDLSLATLQIPEEIISKELVISAR